MVEEEAKGIEQVVRHEHVSIRQEPQLKVTLNRGQRGSYGWEIQYSNVDRKRILTTIEEVDRELREKYGGGKIEASI